MSKTLKEYIEERRDKLGYGILVSNKKYWEFSKLGKGKSESYLNYYVGIGANIGDIVLNYESGTGILGISIVVKKNKEKTYFLKLTEFNEIPFKNLEEIDKNTKIHGYSQKFQGCYFEQTKKVFDAILEKGEIDTGDIILLEEEFREDLETEFKEWFKNKLSRKNEPYDDKTINVSCSNLRNRIKEFKLSEPLENYNLFYCNSLYEFEKIYNLILEAENFKEIEDVAKNIKNSLNRYREFLQERETVDIYTKDDFLKEAYIEENEYDTIKRLLERKKNIILQGAPGVGKTFIAKRLVHSLIGRKDDSKIEMVQFHQSYSYEDFIMGYRPNETNFEIGYGTFYKFCKKAQENLEENYYFIIDEINRGNLSKIFGELFMLIESDKRGEENSIKLLYKNNDENEEFYIPENLYIIGMMNTADRSLAMLDYALRRRFAFYEITPAFDKVKFKEYQTEINNENFNNLIHKILVLNDEIKKDSSLGSGFRIGHSYFVKNEEEKIDDSWIEEIIKYEIFPLLDEYWFDEEEKLNKAKESLEELIK